MFDPAEDAAALRKAMKGFGTDEQALIDILCHRSSAQRQQIAQTYKTSLGRCLVDDLKSELGGKLEDAFVALMLPPLEFLVQQLHAAMDGIGTSEHVLIEILCTVPSNAQVRAITEAYHQRYSKSLEAQVASETSSELHRVLVAILQASRDETGCVDQQLVVGQARQLYDAGQKKLGTDDDVFISLLVTQSVLQLRAVFAEYETSYGKSFIDVIKEETSGDYCKALLAVVKSALNRHTYFAELLHESMQSSKHADLVRLLVSRAEVDLPLIQQEHLRLYGMTLVRAIKDECSGDYENTLVAIAENFS